MMHCYIYKSLKKQELYLYLTKKDDFSDIPKPLLDSFGEMKFVMELEITPKLKLAREDVNKVLVSIKKKGFFVQLPPMVIPEALVIKNNKIH